MQKKRVLFKHTSKHRQTIKCKRLIHALCSNHCVVHFSKALTTYPAELRRKTIPSMDASFLILYIRILVCRGVCESFLFIPNQMGLVWAAHVAIMSTQTPSATTRTHLFYIKTQRLRVDFTLTRPCLDHNLCAQTV